MCQEINNNPDTTDALKSMASSILIATEDITFANTRLCYQRILTERNKINLQHVYDCMVKIELILAKHSKKLVIVLDIIFTGAATFVC